MPYVDTRSLLRDISAWRIDAEIDYNERYFYALGPVDDLIQGSKCFIVGRKGAGKTAIAKHILGLKEFNVYCRKLSLQDIPFNDLYGFTDKTYHTAAEYVSLWRYMIYGAVLSQMSANPQIDHEIPRNLRSLIVSPTESTVGPLLDRLKGLKLSGVGEVTLDAGNRTNLTSEGLKVVVRRMEEFIASHSYDAIYYVVIDEIDEDYREFFISDKRETYKKLIAGLHKAAISIHHQNASSRGAVRPVICVRSDIVSLIEDPDMNKWKDLSVVLNWDPAMLSKMINHRLWRSIDDRGKPDKLLDALRTVFMSPLFTAGAKDELIHGRIAGERVSIVEYMISYSQWRPRDLVYFCQQCANRQIELGPNSKIRAASVEWASLRFSDYLLQEIFDEGHSLINGLRDILNEISHRRRLRLARDELLGICREALEGREQYYTSPAGLLEALYNLCVIGLPAPNGGGFKYEGGRFKLVPEYVFHRGLAKALDLRP